VEDEGVADKLESTEVEIVVVVDVEVEGEVVTGLLRTGGDGGAGLLRAEGEGVECFEGVGLAE
jgi:hypothetical protein